MVHNIFDVEIYVREETKWLDNFLEDLEHTDYDKHQYIDKYRSCYQAELEEFFDSEYGKAFEFDDNCKKSFLLDIYAYASFGDFRSFNAYKSCLIQMIDYGKIFEEYEGKDNLIQRKRRNVKGFKFIF
ncbi:hypothetical protein E4263_04775 [Campylobacter upsaliensis]|nr:hypothetical protein [Campylobacter upsaliensis]